jgi:carbon storage regulator
MLILTRKPGECIYIGDHIKVTVIEIKGNQIRVGIDAPRDFKIYREEIYLQILEENRQAAESVTELDIIASTKVELGRNAVTGQNRNLPDASKNVGLSNKTFGGITVQPVKLNRSGREKEGDRSFEVKRRGMRNTKNDGGDNER